MKQHLGFIDTAKAVGIFLVCIGHFLPAASLPKVAIYSFHVPVFFFIAGMLNTKPIVSFSQYFSKLKSLFSRTLLPYAFWFMISLPYYLVFEKVSVGELGRYLFFLDGQTIWNSPLWFLPSYFLVVAVFYLIHMLMSGDKKRLGLCCAAAFIFTILLEKLDLSVSLLGLDKGVHMLGYTLLGYLCSDGVKEAVSKKKIALASLLLFVGFLLLAGVINNHDNMSILGLDYNEILFYIPVACILCISFMISCSLLSENYVVSLLAKNTCFIMATHYIPLGALLIVLGELTGIVGTVCAVLLFGIYIIFLALLDKRLSSPRIRRLLAWIGLQF